MSIVQTKSDILFGSNAEVIFSVPKVKVSETAAKGIVSSVATRRKSALAKINVAALALYNMLANANANAYANADGSVVYVEYKAAHEHALLLEYDGGSEINIKCDVAPGSSHSVTTPVLLGCLANHLYSVTRNYFETEIVPQYTSAGSVIADTLFRFCDALYYESKWNDVIITDGVTESEFKQAIRTNHLEPIPLFNGLTLKKMNLDPDVYAKVEEEEEETVTATNTSEKFETCKCGAYILSEAWDTDRKAYIPDLSYLDTFVPSDAFFTMTDLINHELDIVQERMIKESLVDYKAIGDNYVNAQFVGKPGTGKTTIANALGATFGMPVRVVVNSKNTEEDTFQGMNKVQGGNLAFVETPFLDCYKNGGILLLEEFNLADPGVMMGALGQALEKPFILLEDGYKEVRRHPLCIVIATMNTGTQGSRQPSEALTSRMPNVFLLDDPTEKEFLDILQKRSGQSKKLCERVYRAYNAIIAYVKSPQINDEEAALSLTLRHCLAALKLIAVGNDFNTAIYNTMIGTLAIKDMELAKKAYENVVKHLR